MNYEILIAFSLATLALAISPGPDNIFVMTQSIARGKKYGLATVAGLMTGCLVHTSLLAFGVSALIKANDALFTAIKVFGALYLVYLAYKVFKSDDQIHLTTQKTTGSSLLGLYKIGFTMNVLNPKVTIFFLAFFPGFLFSDTLNTVVQFYILGFLFIVVSSFIFGSIAVLAGSISGYITRNTKAGPFLKWMQIVVFLSIAIYLLLSDK
ncbi:MAG: LysE family translocator [Croceitalea sp.]|nr:LysE family translocator [Croceitalea sp.]